MQREATYVCRGTPCSGRATTMRRIISILRALLRLIVESSVLRPYRASA
jgi:hypothetical protein